MSTMPEEPGLTPHPEHGIQGDFSDLIDEGEEFDAEVNDEEDEEDDPDYDD